jgi:two-component system, chemotaxis family, chemotaxis protein CheY
MLNRPLDTLRVLIVDDLSGTREVLREMLAELGIARISEAEDGEKALGLLRESGPFDLIVSDCVMENMSGTALLEAVRNDETLKTIPFLMVSGKSDMTMIEKVKRNSPADFLFKPLQLNQLQQKMSAFFRLKGSDSERF